VYHHNEYPNADTITPKPPEYWPQNPGEEIREKNKKEYNIRKGRELNDD
jgi:hypothetical protein